MNAKIERSLNSSTKWLVVYLLILCGVILMQEDSSFIKYLGIIVFWYYIKVVFQLALLKLCKAAIQIHIIIKKVTNDEIGKFLVQLT